MEMRKKIVVRRNDSAILFVVPMSSLVADVYKRQPQYDELFTSESLDGVTGIILYKAYETGQLMMADHKYAIEQLAQRHHFIDIDKVGIHGHSGGGFLSTAAMCQYPDFSLSLIHILFFLHVIILCHCRDGSY